jgi:hypothetical protein
LFQPVTERATKHFDETSNVIHDANASGVPFARSITTATRFVNRVLVRATSTQPSRN